LVHRDDAKEIITATQQPSNFPKWFETVSIEGANDVSEKDPCIVVTINTCCVGVQQHQALSDFCSHKLGNAEIMAVLTHHDKGGRHLLTGVHSFELQQVLDAFVRRMADLASFVLQSADPVHDLNMLYELFAHMAHLLVDDTLCQGGVFSSSARLVWNILPQEFWVYVVHRWKQLEGSMTSISQQLAFVSIGSFIISSHARTSTLFPDVMNSSTLKLVGQETVALVFIVTKRMLGNLGEDKMIGSEYQGNVLRNVSMIYPWCMVYMPPSALFADLSDIFCEFISEVCTAHVMEMAVATLIHIYSEPVFATDVRQHKAVAEAEAIMRLKLLPVVCSNLRVFAYSWSKVRICFRCLSLRQIGIESVFSDGQLQVTSQTDISALIEIVSGLIFPKMKPRVQAQLPESSLQALREAILEVSLAAMSATSHRDRESMRFFSFVFSDFCFTDLWFVQ
jgi:hypothetical protein